MSILNRISTRPRLERMYSDFRSDFMINPITNDLVLNYDGDAVTESISNILLTDKGELPFQPEKGGNIHSLLFDVNTPATLKLLEEQIKSLILTTISRVVLEEVKVTLNETANAVTVTVAYYLKNKEDLIVTAFLLERTR